MASGEKRRIGGKVVYIRKAQRNADNAKKQPERKPENFKSVAEAQNLAELSTYMDAKHGVWIPEGSLSEMDFKSVRTAASEMEFIINEFPQAKDAFTSLRGDDLGKRTLANAGLGGVITLGVDGFSNDYRLQERYQLGVFSKFHPEGTTGDNVVTHESGHLLEAALVRRAYNNFKTQSDYIAGISDWNNNTFAKKIVSEAARNAKKTPDGKGKRNAQLISDVSRYAEKTRGETLAECVADYRANGANAKPLSREVWKILKRELG